MKILKQFFSVLFVLLCVVGTGYAATFDGVRELVSRRAPWLGKHIQFKEIASSDGDCFILQTVGKKLVVQATGANAAAVGVNWSNEVTKIVYFIGNEHMLIAHDSNRLRFS